MGYFEEVQRIVLRIPRGKVMAYGDVARAAGYPGTARQVAWALRDSGSHGLPWHRVVGQGGRILLPDEAGLDQRLRLELEGVKFAGRRVEMKSYAFVLPAARKRKKVKNAPRINTNSTGKQSR